jgi:S-adenosylmethionine/arginine decarboxylase-like enzyme
MLMFHKHLIIRAEINDPPQDPEMISAWMKDLVEEIDMKILMGPYSTYCDVEGNRGITSVTIIETSHIALHTWDEVDPALLQLDVYTCSTLDPYEVIEAIAEFDPIKIEMKYLDREHNLVELPLPAEWSDGKIHGSNTEKG